MPPLILHTRAEPEPMASLLRARGLEPIHVPLIGTFPVDTEPPEGPPHHVLVTSAAAARWAPGLRHRIQGARVVAVGPATARALADAGVSGVEVCDGGGAEAVRRVMRGVVSGEDTVWHVRGSRTSAAVERAIGASGVEVVGWVVYETRHPSDAPARLMAIPTPDVVCFASASAVRSYVAAGGDLDVPAVALGPDCAAECRASKLQLCCTAERPSMSALADAARRAVLSAP